MPFTNLDNHRAEVTNFLNTLETDAVTLSAPLSSIADVTDTASGAELATAINAIIARLVAAGIIQEAV